MLANISYKMFCPGTIVWNSTLSTKQNQIKKQWKSNYDQTRIHSTLKMFGKNYLISTILIKIGAAIKRNIRTLMNAKGIDITLTCTLNYP